MKTRKATKKDLEKLVYLSEKMTEFHSSFDPYYDIYTKYEDIRKFFEEQLNKKNFLYVVTENDKKEIVAFASAKIISIPKTRAPKIGVLVENFVLKEYRGKGVGLGQLGYRMKWFKNNKVKYVEMTVDARNKKALSLWKKQGFENYQIKLKKTL